MSIPLYKSLWLVFQFKAAFFFFFLLFWRDIVFLSLITYLSVKVVLRVHAQTSTHEMSSFCELHQWGFFCGDRQQHVCVTSWATLSGLVRTVDAKSQTPPPECITSTHSSPIHSWLTCGFFFLYVLHLNNMPKSVLVWPFNFLLSHLLRLCCEYNLSSSPSFSSYDLITRKQ